MSDELKIYKTDITLDDGRAVHFVYDQDSDDLEIVFEKGRANCTIELTDNIVLRFDREAKKALSLILISFSALARLTEMGPQSFAITGLDNLPEELRQTVVKILTTPPVNRFLRVSLLCAPPAHLPITTVERLPALAAAFSS